MTKNSTKATPPKKALPVSSKATIDKSSQTKSKKEKKKYAYKCFYKGCFKLYETPSGRSKHHYTHELMDFTWKNTQKRLKGTFRFGCPLCLTLRGAASTMKRHMSSVHNLSTK